MISLSEKFQTRCITIQSFYSSPYTVSLGFVCWKPAVVCQVSLRLLLPPPPPPPPPPPILRLIFMKLHSLNAVSEWPGWWSIILQKAHSSTDCEELQYTHWVLAGWPPHRFALLLHLSILFCTLQQQAIIKTTKTKPPEDCRPCNDRGAGHCIYANVIILVASNSLYHCTILLFFTLHCIFGFCVSKSAVVCHQSFLGQYSALLHNINLGIQISIVYSYSQNKWCTI